MKRASVRLYLEDTTVVQGSVWINEKTTFNIENYMYDYFLEEVWMDGRKIIDIDVTSHADNGQESKKYIRYNSTFGKDQENYGTDFVPFIRYKMFKENEPTPICQTN